MRKLFIIFFLLLPFALSVAVPQLAVHAHEIQADDSHAGHSHDHPADDAQANKDVKPHAHDGQLHEYVQRDHPLPKSYEQASMPPTPLVSIPVSTNIKPPLEPPAYL
ncbi:MAG: hypothetical protein V1721_09540 [Pseudomonadota bacterium]